MKIKIYFGKSQPHVLKFSGSKRNSRKSGEKKEWLIHGSEAFFFFLILRRQFCFTSLPYSCYVHHFIFSLLYRDDGKGSACSAGSLDLDPWAEKFLRRRVWQPTPVFLPGEFHGQSSLAGYSPWGHKESDMTEWLTLSSVSTLSILSCACWLSVYLWRNVCLYLLPIFDWIVCVFLTLSCMSCSYSLDINPFLVASFANTFCHSIGCLFFLLLAY